jgi:hypothetical protein
MANTPQFQKHIYKLNEVSGYYEKISAPVGFIKLPNELRLETPHRNDYKEKAKFILRGRIVNGKYLFFTGLKETGFQNLYFGDHFHPQEKIKNSFCLFRFNHTSTEVTVFYFNHYTLFPKFRDRFIKLFMNRENESAE